MNLHARRLFMLAIAAVFVVTATKHVSAGQEEQFRQIISSQIEAFRRDDATAAFRHASPGIQSKFQTPERFMQMVRSAYAPVYRPKSVTFAKISHAFGGRPTQHVVFVDQSGRVWTALYAFELQPDGTWKIDGVAFTKTDETVS